MSKDKNKKDWLTLPMSEGYTYNSGYVHSCLPLFTAAACYPDENQKWFFNLMPNQTLVAKPWFDKRFENH